MKDNGQNTKKQKDLETIKRFKDLDLIENDIAIELEKSIEEQYREKYIKIKAEFKKMIKEVQESPNREWILNRAFEIL